jgi:DNA-binding NtrC family response regulator
VMIGCAAIHGVADRLLFGGKRGVVETIGHFQMARGGTLYLAGIGDLDPTGQAALLRLLEVRDASDQLPDVGIVGGGHELRVAVGDGKLRDDLFQRLSRGAVRMPSLRSRRVDLVRIVQHEVAAVAAESSRVLGPHPRLLEICLMRQWPGNVRELRAAVRQAAVTAVAEDSDVVRPEHLAETAGVVAGANSAETAVERKSAAEVDKSRLIEAMQQANGSLAVAARTLGVHKNALVKFLDEHGIAYDD